jgi:hypothetical protein
MHQSSWFFMRVNWNVQSIIHWTQSIYPIHLTLSFALSLTPSLIKSLEYTIALDPLCLRSIAHNKWNTITWLYLLSINSTVVVNALHRDWRFVLYVRPLNINNKELVCTTVGQLFITSILCAVFFFYLSHYACDELASI